MTRKTGRYAAQGAEAELEPGSRGRVLRNLLGIRSVREMAQAESDALILAQERLVDAFSPEHRFTAADIREIHRVWLGTLYPWAGEYRGVNIAKGDFHFAAAREVPRLMSEFESRQLAQYTPCRPAPEPEVARALAIVHAELVLIHPFREGNGRCARLLALLMAFQGGLPPLDFGGLTAAGGKNHIAAIHAAMGGRLRTDERAVQRRDPSFLRPPRAVPPLEEDFREAAPGLANGSWMPSIAEEDLAETHRPSLRTAGSRRYGLTSESRFFMAGLYQRAGVAGA